LETKACEAELGSWCLITSVAALHQKPKGCGTQRLGYCLGPRRGKSLQKKETKPGFEFLSPALLMSGCQRLGSPSLSDSSAAQPGLNATLPPKEKTRRNWVPTQTSVDKTGLFVFNLKEEGSVRKKRKSDLFLFF
jgi:hypothetical protein